MFGYHSVPHLSLFQRSRSKIWSTLSCLVVNIRMLMQIILQMRSIGFSLWTFELLGKADKGPVNCLSLVHPLLSPFYLWSRISQPTNFSLALRKKGYQNGTPGVLLYFQRNTLFSLIINPWGRFIVVHNSAPPSKVAPFTKTAPGWSCFGCAFFLVYDCYMGELAQSSIRKRRKSYETLYPD